MITKILFSVCILLGLNLSASAQEKLKVKAPPVELGKVEYKPRRPHNDKSKSTISKRGWIFENNNLPTDLKDSKIGYINLTREQHRLAKRANQFFANKMKDYPYAYTIADNVEDISDCKYRIRLKKSTQTIHNGYQSPSRPQVPITTTQDVFYLYLEDMQTGERFAHQKIPTNFKDTCREFIKAVK